MWDYDYSMSFWDDMRCDQYEDEQEQLREHMETEGIDYETYIKIRNGEC